MSTEVSAAGRIRIQGGTIPAGRGGAIDAHLVSLVSPKSFEAEQYRSLRHALDRTRPPAGPRVVAVTSPGVGDGKTTTAINLAGAYAQSQGARVLLVDADMRRPGVAVRLGLPERAKGLADLLAAPSLDLDATIRTPSEQTLSVLTAGRERCDPHLLLQSGNLGVLMHQIRTRFDRVIVDTPPLLAVRDSHLLESVVDGFLLVVASGYTSRHGLGEALDEMAPGKVLGIAFNRDHSRFTGHYYAYGRYYTTTA